MADAFLTATDKQIGKAFTRAVVAAQGWSAQLDRSSPFDQAALAGFSVMTSLVKDQLEYLLDRNHKRDPDGLLAAYAEQLREYRGFIQECIMPVQEQQLEDKLNELAIEASYVFFGWSFPLHLHLRAHGVDSRYSQKRECSVPLDRREDAARLEARWRERPTDPVADGKRALTVWQNRFASPS